MPPIVRSDRTYRFDVGPDQLWPALTAVGSYRRWWPWLRGLDAAAFAAGERWACEVRPPLPYVLRFDLILEEVEAPRYVTARLEGGLTGVAGLDVLPTPTGSEVRLVSALEPIDRTVRAAATLAPAMVRWGHDWVLDTGLRQFRSALSPG